MKGSEYVLVGLGQEFDMEFFLQSREDCTRSRQVTTAECTLAFALCGNNSADSICRRWKQRLRRDCRSWQKYWKKRVILWFHLR